MLKSETENRVKNTESLAVPLSDLQLEEHISISRAPVDCAGGSRLTFSGFFWGESDLFWAALGPFAYLFCCCNVFFCLRLLFGHSVAYHSGMQGRVVAV
jgi:hypothetical protein